MRIFRFTLMLVLWSSLLSAQDDSLLLTKNFSFKDGVYMDFEAFQKNEPTYLWEALKSNLVANPQTFMAQIEYLELKENGQKIDLSKVWGMSLGGLPYIRLEPGAVKKQLTNFAALKLRGKICYFEYEDYEAIKVPMKAYNPLTGKPFLESEVEREVLFIYEMILNFETGETQFLTTGNLKPWVSDDHQLTVALESIDNEAKEKLFKCLLIYDDRHKVYIKN